MATASSPPQQRGSSDQAAAMARHEVSERIEPGQSSRSRAPTSMGPDRERAPHRRSPPTTREAGRRKPSSPLLVNPRPTPSETRFQREACERKLIRITWSRRKDRVAQTGSRFGRWGLHLIGSKPPTQRKLVRPSGPACRGSTNARLCSQAVLLQMLTRSAWPKAVLMEGFGSLPAGNRRSIGALEARA